MDKTREVKENAEKKVNQLTAEIEHLSQCGIQAYRLIEDRNRWIAIRDGAEKILTYEMQSRRNK